MEVEEDLYDQEPQEANDKEPQEENTDIVKTMVEAIKNDDYIYLMDQYEFFITSKSKFHPDKNFPPFLQDGPPIISVAAYFHAEKCFFFLFNNGSEIVNDHKDISVFAFACYGGSMNILNLILNKYFKNLIERPEEILYALYGNHSAVFYNLYFNYPPFYRFVKSELSIVINISLNYCPSALFIILESNSFVPDKLWMSLFPYKKSTPASTPKPKPKSNRTVAKFPNRTKEPYIPPPLQMKLDKQQKIEDEMRKKQEIEQAKLNAAKLQEVQYHLSLYQSFDFYDICYQLFLNPQIPPEDKCKGIQKLLSQHGWDHRISKLPGFYEFFLEMPLERFEKTWNRLFLFDYVVAIARNRPDSLLTVIQSIPEIGTARLLDGRTFLHYLVTLQIKVPLIKGILSTRKFDPNIQDCHGNTPLTLAILKKNGPMVKELLSLPDLNFTLQNDLHKDAFRLAVSTRFMAVCEFYEDERLPLDLRINGNPIWFDVWEDYSIFLPILANNKTWRRIKNKHNENGDHFLDYLKKKTLEKRAIEEKQKNQNQLNNTNENITTNFFQFDLWVPKLFKV